MNPGLIYATGFNPEDQEKLYSPVLSVWNYIPCQSQVPCNLIIMLEKQAGSAWF